MRSMGGGGHLNAGSAQLKSVNPDAVENWLNELIKGNQHTSIQISDLMSYPVFAISPETKMKEVALLLREKGCTGFPVTDNGIVVGMISRRDFKKVKQEKQLGAPVKAFMVRNIHCIDPKKSVTQAARIMVKYDIGRLPVVENNTLIGIITRSDTMRYYYDLLPD